MIDYIIFLIVVYLNTGHVVNLVRILTEIITWKPFAAEIKMIFENLTEDISQLHVAHGILLEITRKVFKLQDVQHRYCTTVNPIIFYTILTIVKWNETEPWP